MGPLFADAEADDFSQVPAVKGLSGVVLPRGPSHGPKPLGKQTLRHQLYRLKFDLTVRVSFRSRVVFS